jgi:hypothetical protein
MTIVRSSARASASRSAALVASAGCAACASRARSTAAIASAQSPASRRRRGSVFGGPQRSKPQRHRPRRHLRCLPHPHPSLVDPAGSAGAGAAAEPMASDAIQTAALGRPRPGSASGATVRCRPYPSEPVNPICVVGAPGQDVGCFRTWPFSGELSTVGRRHVVESAPSWLHR